jgi:hypothetical protein
VIVQPVQQTPRRLLPFAFKIIITGETKRGEHVVQRVVYQTYRRVHNKRAATYISNFLIYINLKIITFKMFIRRNFMSARSKHSDTKSAIYGKNVNLHGSSLLVAVPF